MVELATLPLNIHPDVKLKITSTWQHHAGEASDEQTGSPIEFQVDGPSEVCAFLERVKKLVASQDGVMSSSVRWEVERCTFGQELGSSVIPPACL